jgi:hypothetical protein
MLDVIKQEASQYGNKNDSLGQQYAPNIKRQTRILCLT